MNDFWNGFWDADFWVFTITGLLISSAALNLYRADMLHFSPRVLPTVLIVVDIAAAVGYGATGGLAEWRKVVYWLAVATLTCVVTW